MLGVENAIDKDYHTFARRLMILYLIRYSSVKWTGLDWIGLDFLSSCLIHPPAKITESHYILPFYSLATFL